MNGDKHNLFHSFRSPCSCKTYHPSLDVHIKLLTMSTRGLFLMPRGCNYTANGFWMYMWAIYYLPKPLLSPNISSFWLNSTLACKICNPKSLVNYELVSVLHIILKSYEEPFLLFSMPSIFCLATYAIWMVQFKHHGLQTSMHIWHYGMFHSSAYVTNIGTWIEHSQVAVLLGLLQCCT